MGVYINMEMPKYCGECPFKFRYWFYDFYICAAQHGEKLHINVNTGFDDRCPLVPVSAHGRLIDVDKLMQEMRLFIKENMLSRDDARELLETIEDAPTIIEAEEVNT